MPVVERAGRLALYRANNPSDDSPPQPGDIGPVIRLWHKPVAPAPGARGIGADLIDLPPGQAKVRMPRECWAGDALGTIVVTIYLLAEPRHPPPPKELRINIAKTIDLLLKTSRREELELLLVPTVAIETPARPDRLRFALASCQYARGMIDGTPAALRTGSGDAAVDAPLPGPSDASYARLGRVIDGDNDHPRLQFAVLAGDQVYVDATAGLFDPTASRGRYRKPYEQLYGSRVVQDVQRRLPMYMVLDDHEIEDNWEDGDDRVLGPRMVRARQFYGEYERSTDTLPDIVPLWCEKPIDGFDFFFADTRTERRTRDAGNVETAEILGAAQAEALAALARAAATTTADRASWCRRPSCCRACSRLRYGVPRRWPRTRRDGYPEMARRRSRVDRGPWAIQHRLPLGRRSPQLRRDRQGEPRPANS